MTSEQTAQLTAEQRAALARAYRYLLSLAAWKRAEQAKPDGGPAAGEVARASST